MSNINHLNQNSKEFALQTKPTDKQTETRMDEHDDSKSDFALKSVDIVDLKIDENRCKQTLASLP